jgi:hypothetical protein
MCSLIVPAHAETRISHDTENVVASRLSGRWTIDHQLTRRLTGEEPEQLEIEFINDAPILAVIPLPELIRGKQIHLAGTMKMNEMSYPFVLITHHGNPHVVFFKEGEESPLGDLESFTVMMAIAAEEENDLLFTGGDFNNQPFLAFTRMKEHYDE